MDWDSWQETLEALSNPDAEGLSKGDSRKDRTWFSDHRVWEWERRKHNQDYSRDSKPGNHTTEHFAYSHIYWRLQFFELMIKGMPKNVMLWIKSKAILKYRVNNFSYIFFSFFFHPVLNNVIHWLIYHILGKEKSSSLLLLKVALIGQYPVITNPTNHNRLLFKDIKQIGGYHHLSGSFSTWSLFHVTDTLTVSLKNQFGQADDEVQVNSSFSCSGYKGEVATVQEHPFGSLENRQACSPWLSCYKALLSLVTSNVSHCKVLDIVLETLCPDTH